MTRVRNLLIGYLIFVQMSPAFAVGLNCDAKAGAVLYTVQPGETLSDILFKFSLSPLWGSRGFVKDVYQLNRDCIVNEDLIIPGKRIRIPATGAVVAAPFPDLKVRLPSNEAATENVATANSVVVQQVAVQTEAVVSVPTPTPTPAAPLVVKPVAEVLKPAPVVAQVPSPTPAVPSAPSSDSHISISLGEGYSRIDSTINSSGAQANLLSQLIQEVSLRWEQHWTEEVHSFIGWAYTNLPFRSASQGTLNDGNQTSSELNLGGNYHFGSPWSVEGAVGMRDYAFVPSFTAGTATLEMRKLFFTRLTVMRDLAHVRSLSLKGGLGASLISSSAGTATYDIQQGQSYFGLLHLSQKFERYEIFAEAQYEEQRQNTSLFNQNQKFTFGRLGISWDL